VLLSIVNTPLESPAAVGQNSTTKLVCAPGCVAVRVTGSVGRLVSRYALPVTVMLFTRWELVLRLVMKNCTAQDFPGVQSGNRMVAPGATVAWFVGFPTSSQLY
jgi:hypothetical protein